MAVVGTAITVGLAGCPGDDENGDDGAGLSPTDTEPGVGEETDGPGETETETETDDPLGEGTETGTENGTETPLTGEERGENETGDDGQ